MSLIAYFLRSTTLPIHLSYEGGIHISNYRLTYQPHDLISGVHLLYMRCALTDTFITTNIHVSDYSTYCSDTLEYNTNIVFAMIFPTH